MSETISRSKTNHTAWRFAQHFLQQLLISNQFFERENATASSLASLNIDWGQIQQAYTWSCNTHKTNGLEIREQFQKAFLILSYKLSYEEHTQWTQAGLDAAQRLKHPHAVIMHLQTLAIISYKYQKYHQVIEYSDQILTYTKTHNLPVAVADVWLYRCMAKVAMKQPALDDYQTVLKLAQTEGAQAVLIQIHIGIAHEYLDQKNYDQAQHHYQAANTIARHNAVPYWEAQTFLHLGNFYRDIEKFDDALCMFKEGLAIAANNGDWLTKRHLLASMGDLYRGKMEYEKAKDFYQQAVILSEQVGDTIGVITFSVTIANLALQSGSAPESQSLIENMIKLAKIKNISPKLGELYQVLGNILMTKKSWHQAREALLTAQKFHQTLGATYDLEAVTSQIHLIDLYLHAQEMLQQLGGNQTQN